MARKQELQELLEINEGKAPLSLAQARTLSELLGRIEWHHKRSDWPRVAELTKRVRSIFSGIAIPQEGALRQAFKLVAQDTLEPLEVAWLRNWGVEVLEKMEKKYLAALSR